MTTAPLTLDLLDDLVQRAKKAGADACDAVLVQSKSLSHAVRIGESEQIEREESFDIGLRVFQGKRQAIVSTTDLAKDARASLVERALAMVAAVPEDPFCGLAAPQQLTREIPELDLYDPNEPDAAYLGEMARSCEAAARSVKGVSNSEGAEAGWSHSRVGLAASNGFVADYQQSGFGMGASVIAKGKSGMERDSAGTRAVYLDDLEDPAAVGLRAGQRAVERLNPRKPKTKAVPVVFDPRVSASLINHLAGAVSGGSIARGTSFLKNRMGEALFAKGITIIDDPLRQRGLGSRPFDGEGLAPRPLRVIDQGKLTTWLLDLATARQLKLESTGSASRGTSASPHPSTSNLYLENGTLTPEALMADIAEGFYITELMGMGVNMVTGDYSRGASGFWIEKGAQSYAVSEATIAGNLLDIFAAMTPANDLVFRRASNAPTLRVDALTVAGS